MRLGYHIVRAPCRQCNSAEGAIEANSATPKKARMGLSRLLMSDDNDSVQARFLRAKLGKYFASYGRFCASHPWEVIVSCVTLTVCVLSMSIFSGGKVAIPCSMASGCGEVKTVTSDDFEPSDELDMLCMLVVNCLAILYVYTQFRSLGRTGSKYILGFCGSFVIFSSFVFGMGITFLIDQDIGILVEVVPFFLLLTDLSIGAKLAKIAMTSSNKIEVQENIGLAMAQLGPSLTLDTLVTALAVGVGAMSGVHKLELICCFGFVTIVANLIIFITFFPAVLGLAMEVCPSNPSSYWRLDDFVKKMQEEEQQKKPNPVVQRVKLIMSLGLVAIHFHSHSGLFSQITGFSLTDTLMSGSGTTSKDNPMYHKVEFVPLHQYVIWKMQHLTIEQVITLTLMVAVIIKYVCFDQPGKIPEGILRRKSLLAKRVAFAAKDSGDFEGDYPSEENTSNGGHVVSNQPTEDSNSQSANTADSKPALGVDVFSKLLEGHPAAFMNIEDLQRTEEEEEQESKTDKQEKEGLSERDGSMNTDDSDTIANFSIGSLPGSRRTSIVDLTEQSLPLELLAEKQHPLPSHSDNEEEESSPTIGPTKRIRTLEECSLLLSTNRATELEDEEVIQLVKAKQLPSYKLESLLGDCERGVSIRRMLLLADLSEQQINMADLPFAGYDYSKVMGACCENVIGYMPVPVGVAGPLLLDDKQYHVPMATTEGCLVASTNRGCRAITLSGGVKSYIVSDGMTRAPVVRLPSAALSSAVKLWLDRPENFEIIKQRFDSTSRFAKLHSISVAIAGRLVYIRFKAKCGDAMGMNMVSKGVEYVLKYLKCDIFPEMEIISLSGNYCVDKKPSAINWIEGRGKSVVCEAVIPQKIVKDVLKTNVESLVEINTYKNLIGSAMAGSIGGFNAHAANIVTAIYIATGQDPAQNVGSSNCITLLESCDNGNLRMSCSMPSIEVGTVGGGTFLAPQAACLEVLGVKGAVEENPGDNASSLARIVCATVLAGELSLLSALAAGHLVRSHMTHNRSRSNLSSLSSIPENQIPSNNCDSKQS